LSNPILVEVVRGKLVESHHRGAVSVVGANGSSVISLGDVGAAVFPRSAIKVLQAIPLIESGTADAYGYGDKELALACSSHGGEARHVAVARAMLERAGLNGEALECGAHPPAEEEAARELIRTGKRPVALHNNCSGKHSGMLATARHLGEEHAGYVRPDHPVQRRVASVIGKLTDAEPTPDICAIDGCSVPTWALPLQAWARAFARLASGRGASAAHLEAGARLLNAAMAEPAMVAGEKRFCTEVMEAMGPVAFVKTGAEGVFCAAVPKLGYGIALKIDDGGTRASESTMAALLARLLPEKAAALEPWLRKPMINVAGLTVGEVRASGDLQRALKLLD
jgi:L-asparaginase II